MSKQTIKTSFPRFKAFDDAFEAIQKAVIEASEKGEKGAVFCQISQQSDGYNITGGFYPMEKAKMIEKALKEANG